MSKPVFILGLGAQKAGTTWLYDYVTACAGVAFGDIKEHHVWDVRQDAQTFRQFHVTEQVLFRKRNSPRLPVLRLRYAMQTIDGVYGSHFRRLVDQTGARMTGDLTPSYAALGPDLLARIRHELEANGFQIKVIFLMRDPVERIWSSVRMERRIARNNGTLSPDLPEAQQVADVYRSPHAEARTRYGRTMKAIETVFDPDDVFYGIYEEFFTPATLRRLCGFLDLPFAPDRLDMRVNVTQGEGPLPDALRAQIQQHYAAVYRHCARRFPQTQTLWDQPPERITDPG